MIKDLFSKSTVQKSIQKLSLLDKEKDEYLKKYNKILKDIANLSEIYTLVSNKSTKEEIKNNRAPIFCRLNSNNIPTVWLFSEEKIAMEYADYYNFKRDGIYLLKKVESENLFLFLYNAMFSGVHDIIIDEGRDFLVCSIYDLVNKFFEKKGQTPILEKREYEIMNILNRMKFSNFKTWVIPSKGTIGEEIIFNEFIPIIQSNNISIFLKEDSCKKYSKENGYNNELAIDLDIKSLEKIVTLSMNKNVKNVKFIDNGQEILISIIKLYNILQKMNA